MNQFAPSARDYDRVYANWRRRAVLNRIDRLSCPHLVRFRTSSAMTSTEPDMYIRLMKPFVQARRGALLDVGCGTALLGSWLASELKVQLIGVDHSPVAIRLARRYLSRLKVDQRFLLVGRFEAAGLRSGAAIAAISIDSVYLARNPTSALRETARLLQPNAPFVFSFYEQADVECAWIEWTRSAGFEVLGLIDLTREWRDQMRIKHVWRWKNRELISLSLGSRAASELWVSAAMLGEGGRDSFIENARRYLVYALRVE
jgi:SAM-dependent methyltransferase